MLARRAVPLAAAREKVIECRRLRGDGIDPIEHGRTQKAAKRAESDKGVTFCECALAYIEAHSPGWRNAKHAAQWTSKLETYAFPVHSWEKQTVNPLPDCLSSAQPA